MKTYLVSLLALLFIPAIYAGDLQSGIESTLPSISIPNAHQVDSEGNIFRSQAPSGRYEELQALGIDEVLIFKAQTKNEVDQEKNELEEMGIRYHHIPFPWKDFARIEDGCKMLIRGLRIIKKAKDSGRRILFHCTVGEDRTGILAGLWRMLEEEKSAREIFRSEMCKRGFADGNTHKPQKVVEAIRKELAPLFWAMAKKIEQGELSLESLSERKCAELKLAPVKKMCH